MNESVLTKKVESTTDLQVESIKNEEIKLTDSHQYKNIEKLKTLCNSFVGQKIHLTATFKNHTIAITNPNLVGDLLEDIFYPIYKESFPDFEKGPKQESPDFFAENKEFQFEQKAFFGSPGFDISNFTSFIHQISKPGGLEKKVFKTKYLVYEYGLDKDSFIIKNFWMLNIWNMPTYDNTYPITMQVKKGMWYNIRPGPKLSWSDNTKTAKKFIHNLLECIDKCPHLDNSDSLKSCLSTEIDKVKTLEFPQ